MVREYFDDAAVGDPSAAALVDHALQLRLKSVQPLDPLLDLAQVRFDDAVGGDAGPVRVISQAQQFANCAE
jgi:hypothetical protein